MASLGQRRSEQDAGQAKVDPAVYDAYVGEYDGSPAFRLSMIKRNDRLFCQVVGGPEYELFPESGEMFFLSEDVQITFIKNEQGRVFKLVVNTEGMSLEAKKIK